MNNQKECGKMKTNQGWVRDSDGKIISRRGRLKCPVCNKQLLKLLPETQAENLVVYCSKCGSESIVNIAPVPVP